jgi:hypothetical protein
VGPRRGAAAAFIARLSEARTISGVHLIAALSQADLAVAVLLAIPLGLAVLAMLLAAVLLVALAGCAAASWILGRANEAVLGSAEEI